MPAGERDLPGYLTAPLADPRLDRVDTWLTVKDRTARQVDRLSLRTIVQVSIVYTNSSYHGAYSYTLQMLFLVN